MNGGALTCVVYIPGAAVHNMPLVPEDGLLALSRMEETMFLPCLLPMVLGILEAHASFDGQWVRQI